MTATQQRASDAPIFPPGLRTVRLGDASLRVHLRSAILTAVVLVAALGMAWWSLVVGTAGLTVSDVLDAVMGRADAATTRIVLDWRLPRIVFALLAGAALAVSGAVFQSITRNPLGSPDIIGFSSGAYTGALLVALFVGPTAWGTSMGALAGGLLTGAAVYLLAFSKGVSGLRIIVVGIGVSLFLSAFNSWVLTWMRLEQAITAASWGAGSLADIGWVHTVPVLVVLAVTLPLIMLKSTDMRMLEMGDDAGRGLGVRAEATRVWMLLLAILLISMVTASAGPIAFIALAAPQVAMRLMRTPGVRIVPAAAVGSLLLVSSDLIARTVIAPAQLPVGVVTLCLGGAYLVWLLAGFGRKAR